MNRHWPIVAALFCTVFLGSCSRRLTDFTLISTKNTMLTADSGRGDRVKGTDCVPVIIIPWFEPSLKGAIDKAIEKAGPGYDALVDGVVYRRHESFLVGQECWEVEGTPVARRETAAR